VTRSTFVPYTYTHVEGAKKEKAIDLGAVLMSQIPEQNRHLGFSKFRNISTFSFLFVFFPFTATDLGFRHGQLDLVCCGSAPESNHFRAVSIKIK
jgi:hypothetical protein